MKVTAADVAQAHLVGRVANTGFGHVDAEAFPALPLGRGEEQTVPAPDVEEPSRASDDPGEVG